MQVDEMTVALALKFFLAPYDTKWHYDGAFLITALAWSNDYYQCNCFSCLVCEELLLIKKTSTQNTNFRFAWLQANLINNLLNLK